MTSQIVLCLVIYLATESLAFPGYFEDDDEEDKQHSHYVDAYYKHGITPTLNPLAESTEPTVNMDRTLQQQEPLTKHAEEDMTTTRNQPLTKHSEQEPRKRRHDKLAAGDASGLDHDNLKLILGGEFMDGSWTVTETQLMDSETDPLTENVNNFLTSVTRTRRTNQANQPTQVRIKSKKLGSGQIDPAIENEVEIVKSPKRLRDGRNFPFRTKGSAPSGEPAKILEDYIFPAGHTTVPLLITTNTATDQTGAITHPPIARQGDVANANESTITDSTSVPTEDNSDDSTTSVRLSSPVQDELLSPDEDLIVDPYTTPKKHFTTPQIDLRKRASEESMGGVFLQTKGPSLTIGGNGPNATRAHPLNVMVNGTLVDWREAVALRKGEYFEWEKYFRGGKPTTKRKRKYVFVTKGSIYRVCVLQDYKSLIVSCSIDNAMTICVRNPYITNTIFENEQGVRYNGTIVVCPETTSPTPPTWTTEICVNRRRSEFAIRCPPEGAKWTALTRCVVNYRRAPWAGPFDYMFGEAWVGTLITCPSRSTTEQRYFYITMTCPTTSYPILDVEGLLELVANLTYDYEEDLVSKLNKSLYIFLSPPTPAPTRPPETTTPEVYEIHENETGAIIAKCYHCGMDELEIPYSSACNDAFSNEIMELTPIDHRARAQLSNFRKYCRYNKERDWSVNHTDTRSIYGRWTGGCAVRWIDLSGVYTQRVCRNRHRPAKGRSFTSRRMAKLELALTAVDNGCIVSPMAVLVPFSRAVSLYARFHACVCTGNFCNGSPRPRPAWPFLLAVIGLLFVG